MTRLDMHDSAIECLNEGCGEPVILLHSSGCSGAQWRSLAGRLDGRYRVIAPDLYGYGATPSWPGRGAFYLGHEAEVVHALLDRLDRPAHLVGHSYGGAVALKVAGARDKDLLSLTLIEPAAFHLLRNGDETDSLALFEIGAVAEVVNQALACGDYARGYERFVDFWGGAGAWAAIPKAKRDALAPSLAKVALDFFATFNEPTRLDEVRAVGVPTLLVKGTCSPLPAQRISDLLSRTLPEANLEMVAGAGHMLPLTHRDEVNNLIVSHLEANPQPSGRSSWADSKYLRQAAAMPRP
ncbi:MAG: alpha/beta hydrolase [Alphaproteobacteria bacterium]|nr:alpha/beta hydrolase [Alphaproteobacteria bacterium]